MGAPPPGRRRRLHPAAYRTPPHRKVRLYRPQQELLTSPRRCAPTSSATAASMLLLVLACTSHCLAECPRACECKWKSGKESVLCMNANLSIIPQELDAGTQVLDMTGNLLQEIGRDAFSNNGLTNLQKIYLAKCRVKKLDRYAFRKLTNLVELDLSYNSIATIPSHIFDSISELRELKLSGNPIQRVLNDAFLRVPQLVRLELSECRLGTVEARAFAGLQALEWLKLDRNQLISVRPSTVTVLKSLHGLDLHGNPWNCSCTLRPLREWMLRQNVPYSVPPVCRAPSRLSGRAWDKLELDDFACIPEIAARVTLTKGVEGSNVTMSCHIDGIPEPRVKWLWKNRVIANLSGATFGRKTYVVQEIGDTEKASNLTILAADVQDAGVYICSAENKAGRVEANVTLAMSRRAPEPGLSARVLVAGIVVATLFVLAVCLVAVCVCSVRRKNDMRVIGGGARHHRREDSYEKIEMNHKPPVMNHAPASGAANGPGSSGVSMSAASLQRSEVAIVGGARHPRHSEYHGVPCVVDAADDSSPSTNKKPSPSGVMPKLSEESRGGWSARSPDGAGSSEAGHNADTESCAASRNLMSDSETSDLEVHRPAPPYTSREHREEVPTYSRAMNGGLPRRPHDVNTLNTGYQFKSTDHSTSHFDPLEDRAASIELKDLHIHAPPLPPDPLDDAEDKRYPDLIDMPAYESQYGTESFCTLPRRRYERGRGASRWRGGGGGGAVCSDSQSPLLPDSRYNSSEDSGGSIRRFSGDISTPGFRQRSSSSLNLPSDHFRDSFAAAAVVSGGAAVAALGGIHRGVGGGGGGMARYPSLPASPVLDPLCGGVTTPLLENHHRGGGGGGGGFMRDSSHPMYPNSTNQAATTKVVNSYDYHAAQLERFLEEYRSLQEQLCKMKETCDSLRTEPNSSTTRSNVRSMVEPLGAFAGTPGSADETPRSILKNKPGVASSSSSPMSGSLPGGAPSSTNSTPDYVTSPPSQQQQQQPQPSGGGNVAPPPYWVPRTSLRRYSGGDFYQS